MKRANRGRPAVRERGHADQVGVDEERLPGHQRVADGAQAQGVARAAEERVGIQNRRLCGWKCLWMKRQ
jgi:hypothetical protein